LASREKSGIIRILIFPDFYRELLTREKLGMIGSEFWQSVLAIINHVFAPAEHCRSVTSPIGDHGAASSPHKNTRVTSRLSSSPHHSDHVLDPVTH
jgi:hypothetical protein